MRCIFAIAVICTCLWGQRTPAPARSISPQPATASPNLPDRGAQYDQTLTAVRQLLRDRKFQEAATLSERAVQIDDTRWEAYVTGASAYSGLGMYDDAIGLLQMALPRAPQDRKPEVRTALQECRSALAGGQAPSSSGVAGGAASVPRPAGVPTPPVSTVTTSNTAQPAASLTQAEIVLWKSIENSTRPEDYQGYLNSYPNGVYAGLAASRIEAIAWKGIENSEDQDGLRAFLAAYPNGPHAATVSLRLQKLGWTTIEKSTNPADFRRFTQEFPNSSYVALASNRLEELDWLPISKSTSSENVKTYIDSHPGGMYLPEAQKLYAELLKAEEGERVKEQEDKAREVEQMRTGWTFNWTHRHLRASIAYGIPLPVFDQGKMTVGPQGLKWEEKPGSSHNFAASCSEIKYVEREDIDIYIKGEKITFVGASPGRTQFLKGFPHFCGGSEAQ